MKHRKTVDETVFYDCCGRVSTSRSRARKLREANELWARGVSLGLLR